MELVPSRTDKSPKSGDDCISQFFSLRHRVSVGFYRDPVGLVEVVIVHLSQIVFSYS